MRGTGPHTNVVRSGGHRAGWLNLGWKLPLALLFAILLLISGNIYVSAPLVVALVRITLLLWGGLVAGIAASNLVEVKPGLRWAWVALTIGAYAALAVPGVVAGPAKMVEAFAPVTALTLAAHLGRRDLRGALHDWAIVIGVALYAGLGVVAVSQVIEGIGLAFFVLVAMLPPLVAEAALLLLRRNDDSKPGIRAQVIAVIIATAIAVIIFSLTSLHESTPVLVWVLFILATGLLLGGALLLSLLTMPMVEAASGAREGVEPSGLTSIVRAFMEMSHASILISLAVYLILRLLVGTSSP